MSHIPHCWKSHVTAYISLAQGFSLGSAIGHSPKIVPDVQEFAVQFGQFVRDIFVNTHSTVMHSDAIVFLI